MKEIFIKEKLEELGWPVERLSLGEFDFIGHFSAYKQRNPDSDLFKTAGCFFRPNYERGLLIYALIRKYNIKSYLEVGFGRGYSCLCAAKALFENGGGTITTVDPYFDESLWTQLNAIFPPEWMEQVKVVQEKSQDYLKDNDQTYDFVYIDGDHSFLGVKKDWENTKDKYNKVLLFDDYHKEEYEDPSSCSHEGHAPPEMKNIQEISCSHVIDKIEDDSKELIKMDRRIFTDDRQLPDEEIQYGQVLLTK